MVRLPNHFHLRELRRRQLVEDVLHDLVKGAACPRTHLVRCDQAHHFLPLRWTTGKFSNRKIIK